MNTMSTDKSFPELYKSKDECCGCGACFSICEKDAIIMEPDEEGFLYPCVVPEKCVKCYMCMKVCPFK